MAILIGFRSLQLCPIQYHFLWQQIGNKNNQTFKKILAFMLI
ncbi:unnamed protein product [Paramecium sonneborni]|uniref:Uncharacterized protein n=1 Tax=Paramecium sonneborni TaxID=65129 RepID=A0A8S1M0V4_9CILI|nr:unnamed protein product [Paramecium sonneborni]